MDKCDEYKALMRKLISVLSTGNLSTIDECLSPDAILHQYHFPRSIQIIRGTEAFKKFLPEIRAAFPNLNVEFEELIAEGDRVAARVTFTGTHAGMLMGIPPTHHHLIWTGIFIFRFKNDMIVETWGNWDLYAMLEQLGIVTSRVSVDPFNFGAFPKKVL